VFHVVETLLGLTGLMLLASFLPPLAARLNVPLPVLLAATGCVLGALSAFGLTPPGSGPAIDFIRSVEGFGFTSEAFLFLFLPILLFETALGIDVRRLIDDIAPILTLAIVAVLICTLAVGLALWFISPFGLIACLLLGAIVATTDPIAVVGIFRDLGAPRRLSILVEGESLLNDAAAIALFVLLLDMLIGGRPADPLAGLLGFLKAFVGGLAMGWAMARTACWAMPGLRDIRLAEMTLTLALAYGAFILAEHYLHVSGVVAVVAAGLVIAVLGRSRVSPGTWHNLHETWVQLGFWANSLIFMLASMLVPRTMAGITWTEIGFLAILAAAALLARATVLWGLLPVLASMRLADRVRSSHRLVILWGGLRGAVTLALALGVAENPHLAPEIKRFIALLATGFVLFTLFVYAPTLRPLIRVLGLDRLSKVDRAMRDQAIRLGHASIRARVAELAKTYQLDDDAAVAVLYSYAGRYSEAEERARLAAALNEGERFYVGVLTLANREEEIYLKRFADRVVSRDIIDGLLADAGRLIDGVKAGDAAGYQRASQMALGFGLAFRLAVLCHRRLGLNGPLAAALATRFERLLMMRLTVTELRRFAVGRLAGALGEEVGAALDRILADRQSEVARALDALRLQYPEYARTLETRYLARAALSEEAAEYRTLLDERIIGPEVYSELDRGVAGQRAALARQPALDLAIGKDDLIDRVPLFAGLSPERRRLIAKRLRPRLALPGDLIVRRGDRGDAMYFLSSGAVEVELPEVDGHRHVRLGSGEFFGEMSLISGQRRNADVRSLGFSWLLVLRSRDFQRLARRHADLAAHIRATAETRLRTAEAVVT
jgi:CPA1 family monovalent cation:H+ antiporter